LTIQKNEILIDEKPLRYRFTSTEEQIVKKLVLTPNEVVSYYDLADVIWKDDPDAFSLWALSRMIYKIRNKLWKNELNPNMITNIRGKGYCYIPNP